MEFSHHSGRFLLWVLKGLLAGAAWYYTTIAPGMLLREAVKKAAKGTAKGTEHLKMRRTSEWISVGW